MKLQAISSDDLKRVSKMDGWNNPVCKICNAPIDTPLDAIYMFYRGALGNSLFYHVKCYAKEQLQAIGDAKLLPVMTASLGGSIAGSIGAFNAMTRMEQEALKADRKRLQDRQTGINNLGLIMGTIIALVVLLGLINFEKLVAEPLVLIALLILGLFGALWLHASINYRIGLAKFEKQVEKYRQRNS